MTQLMPYDWLPMQARLIRSNGCDLDVVNAARRSFATKADYGDFTSGKLNPDDRLTIDCNGVKQRLLAKDAGLLAFLGRGLSTHDFDDFVLKVAAGGWAVHEEAHRDEHDEAVFDDKIGYLIDLMWKWRDEAVHDTPFNHVGLHVAIMVPMFVARQLVKHEYMPWSEVSRRYVGQNQDNENERLAFWKPGLGDGIQWREAPENRKQGSGGPLPIEVQEAMNMTIDSNTMDSYQRFVWALSVGTCMEQARMLLPANFMVEVTWSGFLGAFCKMLRERMGLGAQEESRLIAKMLYNIALSKFPVSVPALVRP